METILNNWELILGIASIFIPALLPAKYATKINLVTKVLGGAVKVLEKLDNSKGGLTLSPEFEKQIKNDAVDKISEVLTSKTERFEKEDLKVILKTISRSKGVEELSLKIREFSKNL